MARIAEILQPLLQVPGLTEIERARVAVILANLSDDKLDMAIDLTIINFLANKMALTLSGEEDRYTPPNPAPLSFLFISLLTSR